MGWGFPGVGFRGFAPVFDACGAVKDVEVDCVAEFAGQSKEVEGHSPVGWFRGRGYGCLEGSVGAAGEEEGSEGRLEFSDGTFWVGGDGGYVGPEFLEVNAFFQCCVSGSGDGVCWVRKDGVWTVGFIHVVGGVSSCSSMTWLQGGEARQYM